MPEEDSLSQPNIQKVIKPRSRPIKTRSVISEAPESSGTLEAMLLSISNYAKKKIGECEAELITVCIVTPTGQVGGTIIDKDPGENPTQTLAQKVAEVGCVSGLTSLIHKLSDAME